ncbi:hypothetical protein TNCV_2412911 [Trichonephila clavipes]|nr:hypothetical protein TNCV_2412911 [Trichonephila clavipes]
MKTRYIQGLMHIKLVELKDFQLLCCGVVSGLHGSPKRLGQLKDISKFDNDFFNVSEKQAHFSDPQGRMLLETTYEAIVDAVRASCLGVAEDVAKLMCLGSKIKPLEKKRLPR